MEKPKHRGLALPASTANMLPNHVHQPTGCLAFILSILFILSSAFA